MIQPTDDGYISNYLIHWTGKNNDASGAEVLSIIGRTCQLLLNYNPIFSYDFNNRIIEKMVCFTDIPLRHSNKHCIKYGRFGIAFDKLKLINAGAQPVFYFTHVSKEDFNHIFRFLKEQTQKTTIDNKLFNALKQHFYFMKELSDKRADAPDTYYYEREWRLGEQTLVTEEKLNRPNAKYKCIQEGYPRYFGKKVTVGDKSYFAFEPKDVAFLLAPKNWIDRVDNTNSFQIFAYDELASKE